MRPSLLKTGALSVSALLIALTFNQCSDVGFTEGDGFVDGYSNVGNGIKAYQVSQGMGGTQIRPLDLIWMIDNSGSMDQEAAHVRSNFTNFVNRLSSVPDVKIALISQLGTTGTSVQLPPTNIPKVEYGQGVGSTDALRILASAICPANAAAGSLCAGYAGFMNMRGVLTNFLRPNSQKVLVLVTDDESDIPYTQFRSLYDSVYNPNSLAVFGWIGLGAASPCQARTGQQYIDMAAAVGGEMNNICDTDWSSKFNILANNVVTLAKDTIVLPQDVLKGTILKVVLNGKEIFSPADYKLSANGIIISDALRNGLAEARVRIEYR